MKPTKVKLNDLPELPLEKILSYLPLKDRIKCRTVLRKWRNMIDSLRLTILCYSNCPSGFIYPKSHWVNGAFVHSFISSPTFGPFFRTFGQSILSTLKHLRLCRLRFEAENAPAFLAQTLNSFDQLEELGLFDIRFSSELSGDFCLCLPMLKSIHIESIRPIDKLTLDAPRLQNVKNMDFSKMELVHGESIEKLIIYYLSAIEVNKLKNLKNIKYLYCAVYYGYYSGIDSTLLSTLKQLKEIHLAFKDNVLNLFQQKERYGRSDLKIFFHGCLLNGPSDPAIDSLDQSNERYLVYLIENRSKIADEIPMCLSLLYSEIVQEPVALKIEIDLLKKFTDLQLITVNQPIQDVARFLELLKNLNNIVMLSFNGDHYPQGLFDQLHHCAIQHLTIEKAPADLDFLIKLKSLIFLELCFSIKIDLVSKVFKKLPFLSDLDFTYHNTRFTIRIYQNKFPKQVWVLFSSTGIEVSNIHAATQIIIKKRQTC